MLNYQNRRIGRFAQHAHEFCFHAALRTNQSSEDRVTTKTKLAYLCAEVCRGIGAFSVFSCLIAMNLLKFAENVSGNGAFQEL